MSQNSNWKCDGISKNGKTYEILAEKHDLIENFGDTCSVCGLPREAMLGGSQKNKKTQLVDESDSNRRRVNWKYLWIIPLGSAIVGGSVIAMNPCWVEKFFVKCATEQENRKYTSQYEGINKQAENSLNNLLQTNDLKVMRKLREDFNSVILQLEGMKSIKNARCCPSLVISPLLEKDLPKFKSNLVDIDVLIAGENLAIDAGNLALKAQTTTELESAKNGFEDAIKNATRISDKSPLIQKANTKKEEYKKKLTALDEKIRQEKEVEKQREEAKIRAGYLIQKQLDEAKTLGDRAIDKGRLAKTTDELKEVERMLVEAIDKLKQVPRNTGNVNDITSKLQGYESTLSKVRNALTKVPCSTALFGSCVQLPLSLP
jgi:hypothetical protein